MSDPTQPAPLLYLVMPFCASSFLSEQAPLCPVIRYFTAPLLIA